MRRKELLLVSVLLLALLPYFVVCFYALPFADDFCFTWTSLEKISFTQRFLRQYLTFCGRYSADALLCIHPLTSGRLIYNQAALFASVFATLVALFLFIRHFIKDFLGAAIIALLILLFYLCYMPQLSEGVYWFTGISNYGLGIALLLFHIAFILIASGSNTTARYILLAIAALLLIAAIGVNELNATLVPAYYLLVIIVYHGLKPTSVSAKRSFHIAITFFIIALVSSTFVIFSPGNFARSHEFAERFNFLHSVLFAAMQTARFAATWLFSVPALALSTLVLVKADILPDTPFFRFSHKAILPLILFTVFMGAFLPYYGTGILGQHRTINYVFFLFILLWLWMLISVSKQYTLHHKLSIYLTSNKGYAVTIICILIMIFSANGKNLLRDFSKNNFTAYKQEFMLRQDNILKHPEMEIPALQHVPESFQIVDARNDSAWWVNKCMKYFYRDTKLELK